MNRDFAAGVLVGVLIALIWRGLNRPTPPDRDSNILNVPTTKDIEEIREKLRKAAG